MSVRSGGKVCWGGGAAAPAADVYFEQDLANVWYVTENAYNIANPDVDLKGYQPTSNKPGDLVSLHENYDGGTIQMRMSGYYFSPTLPATNIINVKCRWQSTGDDLDVAYPGAGVNFTYSKPNAGAYRVSVTAIQALVPDGVYAVGKALFLRWRRTDADADAILITHVKLRYKIV